MKVKLHGHKKIKNKNTVKLTTGGRARVRNYRWTDSERGGNVNAGPGLVPPARIPALPLRGGLFKVLWVPPGVQEQCHSRHEASSPPTLRSPCSASGSPGQRRPGPRPLRRGWCLQHSSSWYICSSSSWDSRCSRRSVRPLMISSGVFINLNKSLCPGSFLIMFSL